MEKYLYIFELFLSIHMYLLSSEVRVRLALFVGCGYWFASGIKVSLLHFAASNSFLVSSFVCSFDPRVLVVAWYHECCPTLGTPLVSEIQRFMAVRFRRL